MPRHTQRKKQKPPVEPVTLHIQRLSHDGRGIGTLDGKVAFVAGALPGETVTARFTSSRAQFAELDTVAVETPSPDRVTPPCAVFALCGGCSLQHMSATAQIHYKAHTLFELLSHNTGNTLPESARLESIGSDGYHYRRKARLAVRYVAKKGGALVGFREKHGTFITDTHACPVLAEPASGLIQPLRKLISELDARMHIPQIEVAAGEVGQDLLVALVLRHLVDLSGADIERLQQFAQQHGCEMYLQPGKPESIHKIWPPHSVARLSYHLPDYALELRFHPLDFTQINAGINRRIIPLAISLLDPQPEDRVLDLFCGLGNFTLPLARYCREIVGVEGSEEMVSRAKENARLNGINNASFHSANLMESFAAAEWAQGGFDRVLLDPPRSGAQEIIALLAAMRPVRVVYISCNPATLARDAALLHDNGYDLTRAGVMDMFPQTAHVESIALFQRRSPGAGKIAGTRS